MNRSTSIYLDLVRFLAAAAVFLGHVSGQRLTGGLFWQMGPIGPDAVDVFFVLSGFVIAYVGEQRERNARHYFVSRAARIYSVALPALFATFALDAIGRSISPDIYNASWHYIWIGREVQFLQSLVFANQLWWNNLPPGSDFPYWSLGFEVWYYIIFGAFLFFPQRLRYAGILVLLAIVGPKIVALLPIWLLGVLAYRISKRQLVNAGVGIVLWLSSILLWLAYQIYSSRNGPWIAPNWFDRPPLVQDYAMGFLFFLNLLGFTAFGRFSEPLLVSMEGPIRWLAGTTLTLYLFHMPLAQFLAAVSPWPAHTWIRRFIVYVGVSLMVLGIATFTERKKKAWVRTIDRAVEAVLLWPIWNRA